MMSIDEMIAVLQAAKQGKQIECKAYSSSAPWVSIKPPDLAWSFSGVEYRVKREPIVVYIKKYDDGTMGRAFLSKEASQEMSGSRGKVTKFVEVIE